MIRIYLELEHRGVTIRIGEIRSTPRKYPSLCTRACAVSVWRRRCRICIYVSTLSIFSCLRHSSSTCITYRDKWASGKKSTGFQRQCNIIFVLEPASAVTITYLFFTRIPIKNRADPESYEVKPSVDTYRHHFLWGVLIGRSAPSTDALVDGYSFKLESVRVGVVEAAGGLHCRRRARKGEVLANRSCVPCRWDRGRKNM